MEAILTGVGVMSLRKRDQKSKRSKGDRSACFNFWQKETRLSVAEAGFLQSERTAIFRAKLYSHAYM